MARGQKLPPRPRQPASGKVAYEGDAADPKVQLRATQALAHAMESLRAAAVAVQRLNSALTGHDQSDQETPPRSGYDCLFPAVMSSADEIGRVSSEIIATTQRLIDEI